MEYKICTKCFESKNVVEFPIKSKKSGSRQSSCKDCKRAYQNAYFKANKNSILSARSKNRKEKRESKKVNTDFPTGNVGLQNNLNVKIKHPKQKGELTEQIIITELMKKGISVSKPIGDNQPYGLLMDLNDKIYKVQVKTGRLRNGAVQFSTSSSRLNTKGFYKTSYKGKCDIFMVYCYGTDTVYCINIDVLTNSQMYLRVTEGSGCNKKTKSMNIALEFELDKFLEDLCDV